MLLWNFCDRLRNSSCGEEDKAEFALEAWTETQTIQDALDIHNCNLNASLMYMSREYMYKCVYPQLMIDIDADHCRRGSTRMTITQSLRRFVPTSEKYVFRYLTIPFSLQGLNSGSNLPESRLSFNRKESEGWCKLQRESPCRIIHEPSSGSILPRSSDKARASLHPSVERVARSTSLS
jgi:hypothetical protein